MTLYERITAEISAEIRKNSSCESSFIVDIPTSGDRDLYSNAPKIFNLNEEALLAVSYVESVSVDCGFLNLKLKEDILWGFLSQFELTEFEGEDEFLKKLSAYIQLAENEKKLAGETSENMKFTSEVRRLILILMKFQYISASDEKKARILWCEISGILGKLESGSENLKSFVITYEPLLIAARGSLAKFTA